MVYPIKILKPITKYPLDHMKYLNLCVNDIYSNGFSISDFVGDNPKRAFVKCSLCFSSYYPCEYCFSKGCRIVTNSLEITKKKKEIEAQKKIISEKIEALKQAPSSSSSSSNDDEIKELQIIKKQLVESEKKLKEKKTHIVWPHSTAGGPPRTVEEIEDIIEKIENDQDLTIDQAKGVTGRSILLNIPNFDFIKDITVDYLHCVCLGVTKRCFSLTFSVGESRRPRITKRQLSSPALFNAQIRNIKVVREFNRRVRELDFAVYKGQEFRNCLLFFFPLILNCIEETEKERELWLLLTYIIKACVIPSEEFQSHSIEDISEYAKQFYVLYQDLFGVYNCSYNTHIMGSHIADMRFNGPLTTTSAFPFESFYGELRNSFVPGTCSTLKQILSNVLIKRVINNHVCENTIYISEKETPLECNNMIYTFENGKYNIYKVTKVSGENLTCHKQEKLICNFNEIQLNWSIVGVFKKGNISPEEHVVTRSEVKGKIIVVNNFLITCPSNVLREK